MLKTYKHTNTNKSHQQPAQKNSFWRHFTRHAGVLVSIEPRAAPLGQSQAGSTDPAARARKRVKSAEEVVRLVGAYSQGMEGRAAGAPSLHRALEDSDLLSVLAGKRSRSGQRQGQ